MNQENQAPIFEDQPTLPNGYEYGPAGGIYFNHPVSGIIRVTPSIIKSNSLSRSPENTGWTLNIEATNPDGKKVDHAIPYADLVGNGSKALIKLANIGVFADYKMEKFLTGFLTQLNPSHRETVVATQGWVGGDYPHTFVTSGWILGDKEQDFRLAGMDTGKIKKIVSRKTLKVWRKQIAQYASGNPLMVFVLALAFLGPLLKILGIEPGGFHLYGKSSRGKTTLLSLSSSVWSNGTDPAIDAENSFITRWNTTSNAMELMAASTSDMLTCVDELGAFVGASLPSLIYVLFGGAGKKTMTSSREARVVNTWRVVVLSTGEVTVRDAIESAGKVAKAGTLQRMIDIPIGDIFPDPPEGMTPAEFALYIKDHASKSFGSAGKEFVERLIWELGTDFRGTVLELQDRLYRYTNELTTADASPEQVRVFRRLAAVWVAGELAVECEILPFDADEVKNAVEHVRDAWLSTQVVVDDAERALTRLQEFLIRNHMNLPSLDIPTGGSPKAFRDVGRSLFYFTDEQLTEACKYGNLKEMALVLKHHKLLFINEIGRNKAKISLGKSKKYARFYSVRASIMTTEFHPTDVDQTVVAADVHDYLDVDQMFSDVIDDI